MPRLINRDPAYRLHNSSGQAVVSIGGKDHYLGEHGSKESRELYDRMVGEWRANGRRTQMPRAAHQATTAASNTAASNELLVAELILQFLQAVKTELSASEMRNFRHALQPLLKLYASCSVSEFGPKNFKTVVRTMIAMGRCRKRINRDINRLRRIFRWGVSEELVNDVGAFRLQTVRTLRRGEAGVKETENVRPVDAPLLAAIRAQMPPMIRDMVDLQLLTGMRPGELCAMRVGQIEPAGELRVYRLTKHKNAHHGHKREVLIGPKAWAILQPHLLDRQSDECVFSPARAEAARRKKMSEARDTPISCGNATGTNRKRNPKRTAGDQYTVTAYWRAIRYAAAKAFPPPLELSRLRGERTTAWHARLTPEQRERLRVWRREHTFHPHQLRHNAATAIRQAHGLEAAQVILGQRTLTAAQVYAERDFERAKLVVTANG